VSPLLKSLFRSDNNNKNNDSENIGTKSEVVPAEEISEGPEEADGGFNVNETAAYELGNRYKEKFGIIDSAEATKGVDNFGDAEESKLEETTSFSYNEYAAYAEVSDSVMSKSSAVKKESEIEYEAVTVDDSVNDVVEEGSKMETDNNYEYSARETNRADGFASQETSESSEGGGLAHVENRNEESAPEKSYSIIADGTRVTGSIKTSGHIDIVGEVIGNVDSAGNVAVRGDVYGNINCDKMGLEGCRIKGNLEASGGIVVSEDAVIVGNMKTKNLLMDGKMKGNIQADRVAILNKNTYLLGDLVTDQITIEMGASFNGNLRMMGNTAGNSDPEKYFDDFD
jgi:cytoskeletal protein CcmA (bactofilin family)